MEGSVKIKGLDAAMKAMGEAFPSNPEQQRRLLNQAQSGSAKKSIVPIAKDLALTGDSSGALSESIGVRAVSRSRALRKGVTSSVQVTPVRSNRKAIALYIQHYYNRVGRAAPTGIVTSGIRHGHLVEFGTVKAAAKPFLWPALTAGKAQYIREFSTFLKKKTEAAVRRAARKAKK